MQARKSSFKVALCAAGLALAFPAHAFLDELFNALPGQPQGLNKPAATQAPAQADCVAPKAPAAKKGSKGSAAKAGTATATSPANCGAPAISNKMVMTRSPDQLDAMLAGQELSGDQLMAELKALRSAVASQNINIAMTSLMGALKPQPGAQGVAALANGSGSGFFESLFSSATDALLDLCMSELSYQALNHFFATMSDKPGLLNDVTVTMPTATPEMTREMKQQLVTMAGFLVAIKASGKIIDASEKDFDAATESYRKVLDSRMMAARLLGDAFYARAGLTVASNENQTYLSAEQQEFLAGLKDKSPDDLMKDFAVQNIALEYLRKKDPSKYGEYKTGVDEFKTHYGAYARTSVGATSMLGFSSIFLKRAKNMLEKNGLSAAPPLIGMVGSGLTETISLVPRIGSVFNRSPDLQDGSFSVHNKQGEIVGRDLTASKAFSTLNDESRAAFQAGLFKDGQLGYFGNLGEKFPMAGGRILDALVQKENRVKISTAYFEREDWPDFSFQNVMSGSGQDIGATQLRQFRNDMFRSAPSQSNTNGDQQAIALVQKDVRDRLSKWDNSTLRRIILSNRGKSQAGVDLALNDYVVVVESPGMKGIMEYEEMARAGAEHATTRKVTGDRAAADLPAKAKGKAKQKGAAK